MALTVYTSSGIAVTLPDKPIASKGEGSVYRITPQKDFPNHCAKIYHKPYRDAKRRSRIEYMVIHPPRELQSNNNDQVICWPTVLIKDKKGSFLGFIMPLAFAGSETLYEIVKPRLPRPLGIQWQKFSREQDGSAIIRMKVCKNIAVAIFRIHETNKYVLCDFKPENMLISFSGQVSIIDTDSFQISENNTVLHSPTAHTPEYTPPEKYRAQNQGYIEESWDNFSLAVAFYQVLFGIHPFACSSNVDELADKIRLGQFVHGRNSGSITHTPAIHQLFNTYPDDVKRLFLQAFDEGHQNPAQRPSADEWGKTFYAVIPGFKQVKLGSLAPRNPVVSIPTVSAPALQQVNAGFVQSSPAGHMPGLRKWISASSTVLSQRGRSQCNRILPYVFGGVAVAIVLAVFYPMQTAPEKAKPEKDDLAIAQQLLPMDPAVKAVTVTFFDRNLFVLLPHLQKLKASELKYLQPVISLNNTLTHTIKREVFVRIVGTDGNVLGAGENAASDYTYSQTVELEGMVSEEIKLKTIDLGCPSCGKGSYRVEIITGNITAGEVVFEVE